MAQGEVVDVILPVGEHSGRTDVADGVEFVWPVCLKPSRSGSDISRLPDRLAHSFAIAVEAKAIPATRGANIYFDIFVAVGLTNKQLAAGAAPEFVDALQTLKLGPDQILCQFRLICQAKTVVLLLEGTDDAAIAFECAQNKFHQNNRLAIVSFDHKA